MTYPLLTLWGRIRRRSAIREFFKHKDHPLNSYKKHRTDNNNKFTNYLKEINKIWKKADKNILTFMDDINNLILEINPSLQLRKRTSKVITVLTKKNTSICYNCEAIIFTVDINQPVWGDCNKGICNTCIDNNDYIYSDYEECFIPQNESIEAIVEIVNLSSEDYISDYVHRDSTHVIYSERTGARLRVAGLTQYNVVVDDNNEIYRQRDRENEENSDIPAYHSEERNFKIIDSNPNSLYPPLGMELEVYCDEREETINYLRETMSPPIGELILERDGSISETSGIELIFDPMGRSELILTANYIEAVSNKSKLLADGNADPEDNMYGCHLSVAIKGKSPLQIVRMQTFLCEVTNRDFVRHIARRDDVYNGASAANKLRIGAWDCKIENRNLVYYNKSKKEKKNISFATRYAPLNINDTYRTIEFRIFNSSVKAKYLIMYQEFVWALLNWTANSVSRYSIHYKDFIKWLSLNENKKDYPKLIRHLSQYEVSKPRFLTSKGAIPCQI